MRRVNPIRQALLLFYASRELHTVTKLAAVFDARRAFDILIGADEVAQANSILNNLQLYSLVGHLINTHVLRVLRAILSVEQAQDSLPYGLVIMMGRLKELLFRETH